jgi:hypothetical protein
MKPARTIRRGITRTLERIRTERYRQIAKGWTPEHDDHHRVEDMVTLARHRLFAASQTAVPLAAKEGLILEAAAILVATLETIERRAAQ